jgi:hypothetical protein
MLQQHDQYKPQKAPPRSIRIAQLIAAQASVIGFGVIQPHIGGVTTTGQ